MIRAASLTETLLELLTAPRAGGVLALADELVNYCLGHQVSLTITTGNCVVVDAHNQQKEVVPITLSKVMFRALIARFAALCSSAKTMTPYGGTGQIELPDHSLILKVALKNTIDHQWLELVPTRID